MGQTVSQYEMKSRFSVCVCACACACVHSTLTTLMADMRANAKHLQVSSEVCIKTHSSHDSLKLSQAKARFTPSLPIITHHWDLFLMWNIWDNIQLTNRALGQTKTPASQCFQDFLLKETISASVILKITTLALYHNLLITLMFRSP